MSRIFTCIIHVSPVHVVLHIIHVQNIHMYYTCSFIHVIHVFTIYMYYMYDTCITGILYMYYMCMNYICSPQKHHTCITYISHMHYTWFLFRDKSREISRSGLIASRKNTQKDTSTNTFPNRQAEVLKKKIAPFSRLTNKDISLQLINLVFFFDPLF